MVATAVSGIELEQRYRRILAFKLDDPEVQLPFSKALSVEMGWDEDFTHLVIGEYKKFMLLASISPGETVPSVHVDTVWHMHLLHTRSYQAFCRKALKRTFLHHQPAGGGAEEEMHFRRLYLSTLERYESFFHESAPEAVWGNRNSVGLD